jgi:hypothetical protein
LPPLCHPQIVPNPKAAASRRTPKNDPNYALAPPLDNELELDGQTMKHIGRRFRGKPAARRGRKVRALLEKWKGTKGT